MEERTEERKERERMGGKGRGEDWGERREEERRGGEGMGGESWNNTFHLLLIDMPGVKQQWIGGALTSNCVPSFQCTHPFTSATCIQPISLRSHPTQTWLELKCSTLAPGRAVQSESLSLYPSVSKTLSPSWRSSTRPSTAGAN